MKLSPPMIRALRFAALPFADRPRRFSVSVTTWEALRLRGLVTMPPYRITDAGSAWLAERDIPAGT